MAGGTNPERVSEIASCGRGSESVVWHSVIFPWKKSNDPIRATDAG
jgi:hypothetical protein